MDRVHLIGVFVAVVDTGGFAGAARKLGLSPPAVTRAINELEANLGVRLLMRTTRVVRVTDAGTRYAEDCRRILAEIEEADRSVTGLHSEPRGRVSVTAPVLFGARFVMPIVTSFLTRYPDTSASCLFLDRIVNMMDEGIDVGVRIGELPDSSLQAVRVGGVRRVICASPGYLAQHGRPESPGELAQHTLIATNAISPGTEWRLMDKGKPLTVKLAPRMSTTTNDSALAAAVAGFGVARLLSYQVADAIRAGSLEIVLEAFEPAVLPIHVLHREGRYASQKVRAFLDLAIDALRSDASLQR
ncbi:MAG: LysR family transcriptional regulator [Rhizobacter sp.]|nr:LysR family transcriptional regulator [Rhizobacter sp.]